MKSACGVVRIIKCSFYRITALALALLFLFCGCASRHEVRAEDAEENELPVTIEPEGVFADADYPEDSPTETDPAEKPEIASEGKLIGKGYTVVIDPGHQQYANLDPEPIGPGASETKFKVSGGTSGRFTGLAEYELNLQVSLQLRTALEEQGYRVIMTRETNAVDISNSERSQIANEANADAFIRIHANGSEDADANGILAVCMTKGNPYNGNLYTDSRRLSDAIVDAVAELTGATNCGVWETDTMSGVNWSKVPVTILEMGYMTNRVEDESLVSPEYQAQIVQGIVKGLENYVAGGEDAEAAPAVDTSALAPLQTQIQTELDRLDSKWDVWVETLSDGAAIHCTRKLAEGETMVSASLVKLFIMGAVYDRIESGKIQEADVKNDLNSMVTISDNEAANRLTRLLGDGDADTGRQAVNEWAASVDCADVRLNRLMLANNGLENYVSAASCAKLLRSVYRGECVSPDSSESMMNLLKGQQVNDRIPVGLPAGITCAHKTGNLFGLSVGDVGIVFSPEEDYILCVICNDPITDAGATKEITILSQLVYEYLNGG